MSETRAKGYLIAAILWCVILGILGAGYKFLVHPHLKKKVKEQTSSSSVYKDQLTVAVDSFSGYAILRSDHLRNQLRLQEIQLNIVDDKADYAERLKSLQKGTTQLGVFTIDSL